MLLTNSSTRWFLGKLIKNISERKTEKMKLNLVFTTLVAVLALCMFQCNDKPDVSISFGNNTSVVFGRAVPETLNTQVYLLKDDDTISSTVTNKRNGSFVFKDLPFGIYTIKASCGDWFAEDIINVSESIENTYLNMCRGRGSLEHTNITPGEKITTALLVNDSILSINIRIKNATFLQPGLIIEPKRLSDGFLIDTSNSYDTRIVKFCIDSLFSVDTLKVTVLIKHSGNGSLSLKDSIILTYPIDSTGLDSVLTDKLVRQVGPDVYRYNESSSTSHWIVNHNPEKEILIGFVKPMNRQSVEKSITIQPPFAATFFWSNNILSIVPSNSLLPDTTYKVTIGTPAMTMDSIFFRCPFTISVRTLGGSFFYNYRPLKNALYTDPVLPFVFFSYYSIEPQLLRDAFSITPPVDSLRFEMSETGDVRVYHATLLPSTKYEIVIDSSLTSRKGTQLGEDLSIPFTTIAK